MSCIPMATGRIEFKERQREVIIPKEELSKEEKEKLIFEGERDEKEIN